MTPPSQITGEPGRFSESPSRLAFYSDSPYGRARQDHEEAGEKMFAKRQAEGGADQAGGAPQASPSAPGSQAGAQG